MSQKQDKQVRFKELLAIHRLQHQYKQSWLGKLARFQTLQWSINFQTKNSVPGVMRLRIDDIIYLSLLLVANIAFSAYSHSTLYSSVYFQPLVDSFKQYNIMMWIGSALWLIFPHWYCIMALTGIYVVMPALICVVMLGLVPMDPIDPTASMLEYMGYLTLPLLMLEFIIVYPLKSYIRDKIGSVYSYLYAFGVLMLLFMWPVYELLKEFVVNMGVIQLQFLSNNLPILYSLWAIIILAVYLFVHRTLVSPSWERVREILKRHLKEEEIDNSDVNIEDCGFFVRHYRAYSRVISFIIFLGLLGSEGYFLSLMVDYVSTLNYYSMAIMGFMLIYSPLFLVLGSFIINSPVRNGILFAILSISSVVPSTAYIWLYTADSSLTLLVLFVGPFTMLFWMIARTEREENRTQVLGIIFYLYVFFYVPVAILALNQLTLLTKDTNSQLIILAICLGIMGAAAGVVVIYWIVKASIGIYNFITEKQQQGRSAEDKVIDFDFTQEPLNYIPYVVRKSFSLQGLQKVDLQRAGYLLNSLLFVLSVSASLFTLKQVLSHPTSYYYSQSIQNVIISQFPMLLLFYLFFQVYLASQPFEDIPKWFMALLISSVMVSLVLVGVSFIFTEDTPKVVLRLMAIVIFVLFLMAIGLAILKNKNKELHRFLSPASTVLLWFLIVLPFVQIVPVACVWIDQTKFGEFMYYVILGASIEVITAVLVITLIFNALMNRFQEEKRFKFVINELKNYFNDEGIETEDDTLHKLYQSYEFRDKKYYFYLKNGFPVLLESDKQQDRLVNYDSKEDRGKTPATEARQNENPQPEPAKRSCLLSCLDCLCGDDEMFDQKVNALVAEKKIDQDGLSQLLPLMVFDYAFEKSKPRHKKQLAVSNAKKSEVESSKTHYLRSMSEGQRKYFSQINQQIKRNHQSRTEVWHLIFRFFANDDSPPTKMIFNDLRQFIRWSKVDVSDSAADNLYDKYAKQEWNGIYALDMEGFSLVVGDICEDIIEQVDYQSKSDGLLVQLIFGNLVKLKQFREYLDQYYKFHKYEKINTYNSPFDRYNEIKRAITEKQKDKNDKYREKLQKQSMKKNAIIGVKEKIQEKQKQITCRQKSKRRLYDCCSSMGNCVVNTVMFIPRKIKQLFSKSSEQNRILKKRIKPWDILSLEAIQLMDIKQKQYNEEENEYKFRPTFNNIFPAIMKALDLYYFISLSINDNEVGWKQNQTNISPNNGGALYEQYRVLLWVSVVCSIIYMGMSIKAVGYISEGRFGLTETGAIAAFPNLMFFFTNIYKVLSLTLTSFIMTTIYDTFDCTWFSPQPYVLARDSSLQCLSDAHTGYIVASIISMAIYYPICAYVGPNFQFAQKSLDLKYKPSYFVLFFQCKLILVVAGVLLTSENQTFALQVTYISVIIGVLIVLIIAVWRTQPCLIKWFNVVDLMVLAVGLVVNLCGLALYLTNQWVACLVGVVVGSVLVLGLLGWYLWRRFFRTQTDHARGDSEELVLALKQKQKTLKLLSKFEYQKNLANNLSSKYEPTMDVILPSTDVPIAPPKRRSIPRRSSSLRKSMQNVDLMV